MQIGPRDTIVIACLVLFLGKYLNKKISFFRAYNIPEPVTGGVIFSIFFGILYAVTGTEFSFALELRDALLIIFFITIGLSSRLKTLLKGGKSLLLLLVLAVGYLFIQNLTGVGIAYLTDLPSVTGVLGGSVSFSGGHGTTIAWVPTFQNEFGISNAMEMGIACATIGLVLGGFIGGPIAKFLIKRHQLKPTEEKPVVVGVRHGKGDSVEMNYNNILQMIYFIFSTAGLGIAINELLTWMGLALPSFVTALFAGIIVTNLIPIFFKKFDWQPEKSKALSMASDLSLGLFLAMSLMSLQLWTLSDLAGPLLLIVVAQLVVISVFVIVVVFRVMGKDYDAAVMSAGYAGLALGATPTAIANMTAVTKKFGGSPKAFIVVPLVGAFFIDISNALIIRFLLGVFG
ncbi:sodium/glutamate symporter [Aggregatimonas sangjinii]|uniref:Sodium/glutamate symporter n=1 Tax=Aggregatimonas sangjinii TaxID=2583587 RepID=A0A5B7SUW0_9FLAO|nr:sodium/glutamate symporter [Aggregatimonas sangjinii]QCX00620.1 sodium/glutamate symporter [Aggregatimonas sangjinii]